MRILKKCTLNTLLIITKVPEKVTMNLLSVVCKQYTFYVHILCYPHNKRLLNNTSIDRHMCFPMILMIFPMIKNILLNSNELGKLSSFHLVSAT